MNPPSESDPRAVQDALLRQLPLGVFRNDAFGGCVELSERCREITGLTPETAAGRGWIENLHPDDRDRVVEAWVASLPRGHFEETFRFLHPDGTVRWVVGRAAATRDPAGNTTGFVGTLEDVTELQEVSERFGSTKALFDAILRSSSDLVVVVDADGTLVFASDAARRILGRDPQHWAGRSVFDLLHPDDIGLAAEAMVTSLDAGAGVKAPLVLRLLHADGGWRPVEIVANNLTDDPRVGGLLINVRDLSERDAAREAAEAGNRRFEQVFERAPIGMALVSNHGQFLRVNASMCTMLGRSATELLRCDLFQFTHPDDRRRGEEHALGVLMGEISDPIEVRFVRAGGEVAWARVSATVVREDGRIVHSIAHIEDVTEQRRLRDRLEFLATHDPLTGALNRHGLQHLLDERDGGRRPGALVAIDLDRFKAVNDRMGHAAGDELLEQVAARIRTAIRRDDALARPGGDEFIVVVSGEPAPERVAALAERVRLLLAAPFRLRAGAAAISGSIGVTMLPDRPVSSDELDLVDSATYRAKALGGDRVEMSAGDRGAGAASVVVSRSGGG